MLLPLLTIVLLANILGKVLVNLAPKPLEKIEVALFGKAAEVETRPVSVSALIGVLSGQVSAPVNRVNAENIARRQGISLIESKTHETQDYLSLIKVTGHTRTKALRWPASCWAVTIRASFPLTSSILKSCPKVHC